MTTAESLKRIGEDLLSQCPDWIKCGFRWPGTSEAYRVNVPAFTTEFLKLQRLEYRLSTDGSILSASVFRINEPLTIYDHKGVPSTYRAFQESILLDRTSSRDLRLIEMQEDSRHILARLHFHHPAPVEYRKAGQESTPREREMECLAEYLLLPDSVLIPMMSHRGFEPFLPVRGTFSPKEEQLLHHMAACLQISPATLIHRLKDAGFLEEQ